MKKRSLKNVSKKDNSNKSKFDYFYIFAKIFHSSLQSSEFKGLDACLDSRLLPEYPNASKLRLQTPAANPNVFEITASKLLWPKGRKSRFLWPRVVDVEDLLSHPPHSCGPRPRLSLKFWLGHAETLAKIVAS